MCGQDTAYSIETRVRSGTPTLRSFNARCARLWILPRARPSQRASRARFRSRMSFCASASRCAGLAPETSE